jgi:type III restriction enzyme
MKLQFDPNQQFQLDAVSAVVDLFEGQPNGEPDYAVVKRTFWGDLAAQTEGLVVSSGNQLLIDRERLRVNLRSVQSRNDIETTDLAASPESWALTDPVDGSARLCPHFSVEMETGTGKTYVYLRTIFELSTRYGFQKFIIVVPSVAVREGVLKSIQITTEHFRALYNNLPFEHFVYDSAEVSRLRHFAYSNTLQVMVINIDAFRKNFVGTEDERKSNVIYKESDKLSGHQPIEFVRAVQPIVIIDEPQSVDSTERSQEAIRALNPLLTLRYSATHRNPYNLIYRLDPIRAFELRLVKQIVVASVKAQSLGTRAFVRLEKVDYKNGIKAKLRIQSQGAEGPIEKSVSVRLGADLYNLSGSRAEYQDGFSVAEITGDPENPTEAFVRFSNGQTLRVGSQTGGLREDVWRAQIKHTIRRHLENELALRGRGIKVLTLFFVDRVANYRTYDGEGHPTKGKFAVAFEDLLAEFSRDERYAPLSWLKDAPAKLHNGYFAQDRKGVLRDSREGRDTEADNEAYNLIMRDKERLLSLDEPLRFIFSHSALREGWDNPNVFQICTLNETQSAMKKRQEIGRGLRLPVSQEGVRVFDESVNKLYVMANESYEDFASKLQTEYEEDCGVTFGKLPLTALARVTRVVHGAEVPLGHEEAEKVWKAFQRAGLIDHVGRIQAAFDPKKEGFTLPLPPEHRDLMIPITDLLSSYQIERHIERERDVGANPLNKEAALSPEFKELWERIKPKTIYRVEFETEALVRAATIAVKRMSQIEKPTVSITTGQVYVRKGGVSTAGKSATTEEASVSDWPVPDVLAYLQNETNLTRATLARVLVDSGRLGELLLNPPRFLDQVAATLRAELRRILVDGVKYERLPAGTPDSEWEMVLFKNEELVNYLTSLRVGKSVYEYVEYDSEVEREFAKRLDEREDIKLFVKLPRWFEIETPVGKYNPDWAVVKEDGQTLYLVRETKGTKDFLKLRTDETDKVRCGEKHFEALNVSFKVVMNADEV